MITTEKTKNQFMIEFDNLIRKYNAVIMINITDKRDYISIDIPATIENGCYVSEDIEINLGSYYDAN